MPPTEARERKGSAESAVLKGSRWALLKAPENLHAEERVHLSAVAGLKARVYRAHGGPSAATKGECKIAAVSLDNEARSGLPREPG